MDTLCWWLLVLCGWFAATTVGTGPPDPVTSQTFRLGGWGDLTKEAVGAFGAVVQQELAEKLSTELRGSRFAEAVHGVDDQEVGEMMDKAWDSFSRNLTQLGTSEVLGEVPGMVDEMLQMARCGTKGPGTARRRFRTAAGVSFMVVITLEFQLPFLTTLDPFALDIGLSTMLGGRNLVDVGVGGGFHLRPVDMGILALKMKDKIRHGAALNFTWDLYSAFSLTVDIFADAPSFAGASLVVALDLPKPIEFLGSGRVALTEIHGYFAHSCFVINQNSFVGGGFTLQLGEKWGRALTRMLTFGHFGNEPSPAPTPTPSTSPTPTPTPSTSPAPTPTPSTSPTPAPGEDDDVASVFARGVKKGGEALVGVIKGAFKAANIGLAWTAWDSSNGAYAEACAPQPPPVPAPTSNGGGSRRAGQQLRVDNTETLLGLGAGLASVFVTRGYGANFCAGKCPDGVGIAGEAIFGTAKIGMEEGCGGVEVEVWMEEVTVRALWAAGGLPEVGLDIVGDVGVGNVTVKLIAESSGKVALHVTAVPRLPEGRNAFINALSQVARNLKLSLSATYQNRAGSIELSVAIPPQTGERFAIIDRDGMGPSLRARYMTGGAPTVRLVFPVRVCASGCDGEGTREDVYFTGSLDVALVPGGVQVGGTVMMDGWWWRVLGASWLHVHDAVLGVAMLLPQMSPSRLEIGASACVGSEQSCRSRTGTFVEARAYLGLSTTTAADNYFVAMVTELTVGKVLDLLGVPHTGFPSGLLESGVYPLDDTGCQGGGVGTSPRSVASRCFARFSLSTRARTLTFTDNTVDVPQGVAVSGRLDVAGWNILIEAQVSALRFLVDVDTDPLSLSIGGVKLASLGARLTAGRDGTEGGARFLIDIDRRAGSEKVLVQITAALYLPVLRSYGEVAINMNDDLLSFDSDVALFGGAWEVRVNASWDWRTMRRFQLDVHSDVSFAGGVLSLRGVSFSYNVGNSLAARLSAELSVLWVVVRGEVTVDNNDIGFTVSLGDSAKVSGHATLAASFAESQFNLDVDVDPAGLLSGAVSAMEEHISNVASEVHEVWGEVKDNVEWLINTVESAFEYGLKALKKEVQGLLNGLRENIKRLVHAFSSGPLGQLAQWGNDLAAGAAFPFVRPRALIGQERLVNSGKNEYGCRVTELQQHKCLAIVIGCSKEWETIETYPDSDCMERVSREAHETKQYVEEADEASDSLDRSRGANPGYVALEQGVSVPPPELHPVKVSVPYASRGEVSSTKGVALDVSGGVRRLSGKTPEVEHHTTSTTVKTRVQLSGGAAFTNSLREMGKTVGRRLGEVALEKQQSAESVARELRSVRKSERLRRRDVEHAATLGAVSDVERWCDEPLAVPQELRPKVMWVDPRCAGHVFPEVRAVERGWDTTRCMGYVRLAWEAVGRPPCGPPGKRVNQTVWVRTRPVQFEWFPPRAVVDTADGLTDYDTVSAPRVKRCTEQHVAYSMTYHDSELYLLGGSWALNRTWRAVADPACAGEVSETQIIELRRGAVRGVRFTTSAVGGSGSQGSFRVTLRYVDGTSVVMGTVTGPKEGGKVTLMGTGVGHSAGEVGTVEVEGGEGDAWHVLRCEVWNGEQWVPLTGSGSGESGGWVRGTAQWLSSFHGVRFVTSRLTYAMTAVPFTVRVVYGDGEEEALGVVQGGVQGRSVALLRPGAAPAVDRVLVKRADGALRDHWHVSECEVWDGQQWKTLFSNVTGESEAWVLDNEVVWMASFHGVRFLTSRLTSAQTRSFFTVRVVYRDGGYESLGTVQAPVPGRRVFAVRSGAAPEVERVLVKRADGALRDHWHVSECEVWDGQQWKTLFSNVTGESEAWVLDNEVVWMALFHGVRMTTSKRTYSRSNAAFAVTVFYRGGGYERLGHVWGPGAGERMSVLRSGGSPEVDRVLVDRVGGVRDGWHVSECEVWDGQQWKTLFSNVTGESEAWVDTSVLWMVSFHGVRFQTSSLLYAESAVDHVVTMVYHDKTQEVVGRASSPQRSARIAVLRSGDAPGVSHIKVSGSTADGWHVATCEVWDGERWKPLTASTTGEAGAWVSGSGVMWMEQYHGVRFRTATTLYAGSVTAFAVTVVYQGVGREALGSITPPPPGERAALLLPGPSYNVSYLEVRGGTTDGWHVEECEAWDGKQWKTLTANTTWGASAWVKPYDVTWLADFHGVRIRTATSEYAGSLNTFAVTAVYLTGGSELLGDSVQPTRGSWTALWRPGRAPSVRYVAVAGGVSDGWHVAQCLWWNGTAWVQLSANTTNSASAWVKQDGVMWLP